MNTENKIAALGDDALLQSLAALSAKENEATVELLLHLGEVDRRRLFAPAGHSSMFDYCTRRLRYSEPAAARRIACARALRQFPELTAALLSREVSLTTLSMVSGILKRENLGEVIGAIGGRSKRAVEEFVSGYRPRPAAPRERVRPVAIAPQQEAAPVLFGTEEKSSMNPALAGEGEVGDGVVCGAAAAPGGRALELPAPDARPQPMRPAERTARPARPPVEQRYEVKFTISAETLKKLEEAELILSGKYPRGVKLEDVFAEALEYLLERRSPRRRLARRMARRERAAREAKAEKETQASSRKETARAGRPSGGRRIPAAVRDEVRERDGGRCTFVSAEGVRCGARHDLEYHHEHPFALGGEGSVENIRLLCRRHNALEAERVYGAAFMAGKLAGRCGEAGEGVAAPV